MDVGHLTQVAQGSARPDLAAERLKSLAPALDALWIAEAKDAKVGDVSNPRSLLRPLAQTLAASGAVYRYLNHDTSILQQILDRPISQGRQAKDYRKQLWRIRYQAKDDKTFGDGLRRYRVAEWTRIVIRSLGGIASTEETLQELSDLAREIVSQATRYALRRERSRGGPLKEKDILTNTTRSSGFCVIAQGKLGGSELNLSSDIDIQFFYSSDDTPEGDTPLHQRYVRVATSIRSLLSDRTPAGYCYRVDLDLRPEGTKGALANAIAAAERYYETWGQGWERLALVRASHAGGARWVSEELLRTLRPFVFRKSLSASFVQGIYALHERAFEQRKLAHAKRKGALGVDIKRDPGGIREAEFFVQLHQVLLGAKIPALQNPTLPDAVRALQIHGVLAAKDAHALVEAYLYLRRYENCLQALDERQTHRLGKDENERLVVAHLMGHRRSQNPINALKKAIGRRRRIILALAQRWREHDEAAREDRKQNPMARLLWERLEDDEALQILHSLGFVHPGQSLEHLRLLRTRPQSLFSRAAKSLREGAMAEAIFEDITRSPNPGLTLKQLVDLEYAQPLPGLVQAMLQSQSLRLRLFDFLGTSETLGKAAVRYPKIIEWFERTSAQLAEDSPKDVGDLRNTIQARAERLKSDFHTALSPTPQDDALSELMARSLRRVVTEESIRVALMDLADTLEPQAVGEKLSLIAEAALRRTLEISAAEIMRQKPQLAAEDLCWHTRGFVILGLGSLGAMEMSYGSDLDLIFVHDPDHCSWELARALAQSLLRHLSLHLPEGRLYECDTRLRPSGGKGPLVASAEGFCRYQQNQAEIWEHQALLRARPVAGDFELGRRVLGEIKETLYPKTLDPQTGHYLWQMRQRMLSETGAGWDDIKLGPGGLSDIEFASHYLVMRHGHAHERLRCTGTFEQLQGICELGLVRPKVAESLIDGYTFLRVLDHRLRLGKIGHGRAGTQMAPLRENRPEAKILSRTLAPQYFATAATTEEGRIRSLLRKHLKVRKDVARRVQRILGT